MVPRLRVGLGRRVRVGMGMGVRRVNGTHGHECRCCGLGCGGVLWPFLGEAVEDLGTSLESLISGGK